ncbi:unnamed protein product [Danaus chrysippus]|uniref:(African queen) hypothetical protein n=1 Tax=Danaus chrysippus TaxID=151541 RepID=A0A8J2QEA5_9NEOP|nr:unnamed protein product [Danaus chrysippus]
MVRKCKKRRLTLSWSVEDLKQAIDAVLSNTVGCSKSARLYNIHQYTLQRYVAKIRKGEVRLHSNPVDRSSEIRLVQEIEKFEYLYNNFLPEYKHKDLANEAWAQISSSTKLSVAECKEKWTNIRRSLVKNLKPSEKPKKQYYLMPYLQFLMPFLKPFNNYEQKDEPNTSKETDIFISSVKSEDECQLICDTIKSEIISDEDSKQSLPNKRKRKEGYNDIERKRQEIEITYDNSSIPTSDSPRTVCEAMRYFLLSLLPEFETMSEDQIRQFKLKVMMDIDDIKSNGTKAKSLSYPSSNRLQKGIIIVRTCKKRRLRLSWSMEDIKQAIDAVLSKTVGYRKSAQLYNIPQTTLERYIAKIRKGEVRLYSTPVNMSSEIRLVQEIEKFECLYNHFLPEYTRKDLADEAWAQVSSSTKLSVSECKEKWRNIRSSLLRNLKPSEKPKKQYYLMPYLHYLIPFLRPNNNHEQKDEPNTSKETDIFICSVKSEDECQLICDTIKSEIISDEDSEQSLPNKRKRKEGYNDIERKRQEIEITYDNSSIPTNDAPRTVCETMRYFLLSLLPEFETMSEDQIRQFKLKVMMDINDIKSNGVKVKSLSDPSSNHLEKRLINLLLKNLEKR